MERSTSDSLLQIMTDHFSKPLPDDEIALHDFSADRGAYKGLQHQSSTSALKGSDSADGVGQPCRKTLLTLMDIWALMVSCTAFMVGIICVFDRTVAMWLGQTDQLIVLGFVLSIMAIATQRAVLKICLVLECRLGASTLQNFDALLRNDLFGSRTSIAPRIILLFLIALPLGLSASYKRFLGGHSTVSITFISNATVGVTAPPAFTDVAGQGNSLIVNAYLPFWQNVSTNSTYGFNLYVDTAEVSAVLDTPFPSTVSAIQEKLGAGQSLQLSMSVNATVAENMPLSTDERNYLTHFDIDGLDDNGGNAADGYQAWFIFKNSIQNGYYLQMVTGGASFDDYHANDSLNYYSIFLADGSELFSETAMKLTLTRRLAYGTWNITRFGILLHSAAILETAAEALENRPQGLVQEDRMTFVYFDSLLGEYNWRSYPRTDPSVNTAGPLLACMAWARLCSQDGSSGEEATLYSPLLDGGYTNYTKAASEIAMLLTVETLSRSRWLLLILAIHPVLLIAMLLLKMLMWRTPVGNGFGIISLLDAVELDSLKVVQGAGLSGQLKRDVRVRFEVVHDDANRDLSLTVGFAKHRKGSIRVILDESAKPGLLHKEVMYG